MTQREQQRLCGSRVYNASNCHSKIRKVAQNRFETIYLCGKHAFNYSIVTKNNATNTLKEVTFPTRKEAIAFFTASIKKYNLTINEVILRLLKKRVMFISSTNQLIALIIMEDNIQATCSAELMDQISFITGDYE